MAFHSTCRIWVSLARVAGGAWLDLSRCPKTSHRCSIGLRSGEQAGHIIIHVLLPQEVGHKLGPMRRRFVVLEDGALPEGSKRRQSNRSQNFVAVPDPVQDTVNGKERGPGTETHATPDHHGAAAVSVVLADRGVRVPLALPPPHPNPAVVE